MNECKCCMTPTTDDFYCQTCVGIMREIPAERIIHIWDNRNIQACVEPTEAERKIVTKLWDRIPSGGSCWMSAFYCFLHFSQRQQETATA